MKLKHIKTKEHDYYEDAQGRLQGEFKNYWNNGQLCTQCYFKDNKFYGEYKRYNSDGTLKYHTYYENDIEKGLKYLKIKNLLEE